MVEYTGNVLSMHKNHSG